MSMVCLKNQTDAEMEIGFCDGSPGFCSLECHQLAQTNI